MVRSVPRDTAITRCLIAQSTVLIFPSSIKEKQHRRHDLNYLSSEKTVHPQHQHFKNIQEIVTEFFSCLAFSWLSITPQ